MAALRHLDFPAGSAICNVFSVNVWLPLWNILTILLHTFLISSANDKGEDSKLGASEVTQKKTHCLVIAQQNRDDPGLICLN